MSDEDTPTATDGLAARLRAATDAAHRAAESTPYITALLDGRISRAGYAALVAQHYFIYETLEQAAEAMRDDPVAGPFVADELTRLPRLAEDLAFLLGPDWQGLIGPNAATQAYRQRLRETCFTWPGGFIAHHYTRYLGDLSGGAFVAASVRRTYGFTADDGTRFYQFDIAGRGRFKREYRARLDALELSTAEFDRVAEEAVIAFFLNRGVFHELGDATMLAA